MATYQVMYIFTSNRYQDLAITTKQWLSIRNVENNEKVVAKLMSYVLSLLIDAMSYHLWENYPSGIKIILIDWRCRPCYVQFNARALVTS